MSLENDLSEFEAAITRVSREYDAFLYGSTGRLPAESRRQLEALARTVSNQKMDAASDRYRFNTLIGRYNAQIERWDRAVREKEEGRGRFARAAARPNAPAVASVQVRVGESPDRALFDRYVRAKEDRGEDVTRLSFERFREQLNREREKLRERTGKSDWEFDVAADSERVRLAVRPGKGKEA